MFSPQIHPDQVEDDDTVLLLWDFKLDETISVTSSRSLVQPRETKSPNRIPFMPLLDLTKVDCNCSNFPRRGKVILANGSQTLDRGLQNLTLDENAASEEEEQSLEEEEDDESDGEEEEFDFDADAKATCSNTEKEYLPVADSVLSSINDTLFTESFTLKGSSFHDHFQAGLKVCKEAVIKKAVVPLKLVYEPINRKDENAIVVQAQHDTGRPIGYIPGVKVPNITQAIEGKEIVKIVLSNVKYQYVFLISSFKYFATVAISKKGKWRRNKDTYKYNENI